MMKYKLLPMLLCILFICSCAKSNDAADSETSSNVSLTPQPHTQVSSDITQSSGYYGEPKLTVTQSVAYVFKKDSGNTLYTACEYTNNSHNACTVTQVVYHLTVGEESVDVTADQPASGYCVIEPGRTFYNAAWTDTKAKADDTVKVESVEISVEVSDSKPISITGKNTYIVRNYPAFASVSGDLISSDDALLNLTYIGLYDANDRLIGVWCASEPSKLVAGEECHFTMHMKDLPIEDLEDTAKNINVVGFGYNA